MNKPDKPAKSIDNRNLEQQQLHLLAQSSLRINQLETVTEAADYLCQQVKTIIGKGYVAVTLLDEATQTHGVKAFLGIEDEGLVNAVIRLVGGDPRKAQIHVKDFPAENLPLYNSGRLELLKDGVYTLLCCKYPRIVCSELARLLHVRFVYTMGFLHHEKHIGGLSILTDSETAVEANRFIMESMAAQSAAIISRIWVEESLKKSEALYRLLADNVSDVIWTANMNLETTYISPSIYAMQGHTPEEAMNLKPEQRFTPESLEMVSKRFMKALANEAAGIKQPEDIGTYEAEYIRKDGSTYWTETEAGVIRDAGGKAEGILGVTRDISRRKQAEEKLRKSEAQYRLLAEHTTDFIWLMDMNLRNIYLSPSILKRTGFTEREVMEMPLGRNMTPDSLKVVSEMFLEYIPRLEADPNCNPLVTFEIEYVCKDGTTFWAENTFSLIRDDEGRPMYILGEAMEITERRLAAGMLARSEEKYRNILGNMQDSYIEVDLAGNFTFVNEAACRNLGYSMEELIGRSFSIIAPDQDETKAIFNAYGEVYKTGKPHIGYAFKIMRKDGTTGYGETSISLIKNEQGKPIGFRSVGRDVTERKQMEQKLLEMATHDALTGLPNRTLLYDRCGIALANVQRYNKKLAVMTLDLDLFKNVNDTLGHDIGDRLLIAAAGRLTGALRKSDTVARMGGDEFVLLLGEVDDRHDAVSVAEKILEDFRRPFLIDGYSLNVPVSIGIAIYPENGDSMEELLKSSDNSMYIAKQNGRDGFVIDKVC